MSWKAYVLAAAASSALAAGHEAAPQQGPVRVEIRGGPGNHQLYRGGAPYVVKGAGSQNVNDLESLRRHGGNSVRNWAVEDGAILDRGAGTGLDRGLVLERAARAARFRL